MVARFLFVMLLAISTAEAQVYRWTDENGKVHYGERPPAGSAAVARALPGTPAPPPAASRGTDVGARVSEPRKPAGPKSPQQLEAEFQSRQAAKQRMEEERAKSMAASKARDTQKRADAANESARQMREAQLQSDRAANRRRQQDPGTRQRDVSRAYDDAWRRRKGGESTERTY